MNRKKRRRKRILLCILVIIIISVILYFLLFKKIISKSVYLENNKEYGYTLEMRDTKLMKDIYYKLDEVLNADKLDYEKYAEYLSELFVIDLYTIDNKKSKFDVGSCEYIYPEKLDSYKAKVEDTLYKYIGLIEELPTVSSIEVISNEEDEYEYNDKTYDAYKITLSWEYKKDLGYDDEAEIIVAKMDDKLYVVEFSEVEA